MRSNLDSVRLCLPDPTPVIRRAGKNFRDSSSLPVNTGKLCIYLKFGLFASRIKDSEVKSLPTNSKDLRDMEHSYAPETMLPRNVYVSS